MGIPKFMHVYHLDVYVYVCLPFGFHLQVGNHNMYLNKNRYVHAVDTAFTNL